MTGVDPDTRVPSCADIVRFTAQAEQRTAAALKRTTGRAAHWYAVRTTVPITLVVVVVAIIAERQRTMNISDYFIGLVVLYAVYLGSFWLCQLTGLKEVIHYRRILYDLRVQHLLGHAHDPGRPRTCTPASCPGLRDGVPHMPPPGEDGRSDDDD